MAWKKIDDYCGSVYVDGQPYSAFVAQGLTNNARSYPLELAQGSSRAFSAGQGPVKWASYGEPTGTVIFVNAGLGAYQVNFAIRYATETAHVRNSVSGYWFVYHIASNTGKRVGCPPSVGGATLDITFDLPAGSATGYQAFWIGFQSEVLDSKGDVEVEWIDANNVGLHEVGNNPPHYQITTGEKFEIIILDEATYSVQGARVTTNPMQLGYVDALTSQEGLGIVFPAAPVFPSVTGTTDSTKANMTANVYELGAVTLTSISYYVLDADPAALVDQFNHYDAIALTGVNSVQTEAVVACRPEIANGVCEPFHLGRYVTPQPDAITSTFCVPGLVDARLEVVFSLVAAHPISTDTSASITFSLDVLDSTGASILPAVQMVDRRLPRYVPTFEFDGGYFGFRALTGVFGLDQTGATTVSTWGLRDAIPYPDIRKGTTVTMTTEPCRFYDVTSGAAYTLRLETSAPVYVFAFSARLV
jgi:hypothetical protein